MPRPHLKPFGWYGGKEALAPLLCSLLPTHTIYCEVFGGSGALLFAKPKSRLEIFNDLDGGVVNFFRVLRNREQMAELVRLLSLTPYAHEEYYACLKGWETEPDPVERARQWYVGVMQSIDSSIRNTGWSCTKDPGSNPASAWRHVIARLHRCAARLSDVQIDHRDFERVLYTYDGPDTCFYLDPPYLPETRRKRYCYHQEMSLADHERLLACLASVQGKVLLSGYAHPLYQEALSTWDCLCLNTRSSCSVRALDRTREPLKADPRLRIECIWRNPACIESQPTLFGDLTESEVRKA
jgi:DNA adenine methylase